MKDQVVMSKNNGELCVAIPLFRLHHQESLGKMEGYVVALMKSEPTAYVLEHPEFGESLKLFNAEFIENNMEFLGELGDDEIDVPALPETEPQQEPTTEGESNGSSI